MKEYLLTSIPNMTKCPICESNVLSHSKVKCCSVCKMEHHFNCISLHREERGRLNQETNWYCPQCIEQIFPFNHIVEESEFLLAISPTKHDFYTFDYSKADIYLRDPDINFHTGIHSSVGNNCKYYMEDDFNGMIQRQHLTADNDALSFCHLNIRSAVKNLNEFSLYLDDLKHSFSVIAISETWLQDAKYNLYSMNGCKMVEKHQEH